MTRWLLALFAMMMLATGAAAQPSPTDAAKNAHEQLVETMEEAADYDAMADNLLQAMVDELSARPGVATLDRENPGVLASLPDAIRPILSAYSDRLRSIFRARLVPVLQSALSTEEARSVAEFYASPIGRKIVEANSRHFLLERTIAAGRSDNGFTADDVEDDLVAISRRAYSELDAGEIREVEREYALRPGLAKLDALLSKIAALRTEVEKEPMTSSEQTALRVAMETAFRPWLETSR